MTNRQQLTLNSYIAMRDFLLITPPFKVVTPAFIAARDTLGENIVSIQSLAKQQSQVITGISGDKKVDKLNLIDLGWSMSAIIYSWSSDPINNTIRDQVSNSISDIKRMKDIPLINFCANILKLAVDNATALVDFGLTDQQTQQFTDAIKQYEKTKGLARSATVQRSANKKAMALVFKQTNTLFKTKLDKMMLPIATIDAIEYEKYIGSKNIVGNSTTVTQLKGKVTSITEVKGIKNVTVKLLDSTDQQTTTAAGIFSFKGLAFGNYSIVLNADGYKEMTITNIDVKQGQMNTQKITMEKV